MQTDSAKDFIIKEKKVISKPASANEKKQKIKQGNMSGRLLLSIIAGVLAALFGGVVWLMSLIITDEVNLGIAICIGGFCGLSVSKISKGNDNLWFPIIAILTSILGIFIGKYLSFVHYLFKMINKNYSISDSSIEIFSEKLIRIFIDNFASMFGGVDILCILASSFVAWVIVEHNKIK